MLILRATSYSGLRSVVASTPARSRSAISAAVTLSVSGSISTNSSPPKRTGTSPWRARRLQILPMATIASSPTRCP